MKGAEQSANTEKIASTPRPGIELRPPANAADALLLSYRDWLSSQPERPTTSPHHLLLRSLRNTLTTQSLANRLPQGTSHGRTPHYWSLDKRNTYSMKDGREESVSWRSWFDSWSGRAGYFFRIRRLLCSFLFLFFLYLICLERIAQ